MKKICGFICECERCEFPGQIREEYIDVPGRSRSVKRVAKLSNDATRNTDWTLDMHGALNSVERMFVGIKINFWITHRCKLY